VLIDSGVYLSLVKSAEKEGRSVTRQTEFVLKQGILYGPNWTKGIEFLDQALWGGKSNSSINAFDITIGGSAHDISALAGAFLDLKFNGRGKDERIARDLGISAAMAKLLRRGRAWTVSRLDQAMELWPDFRGFVFRARSNEQITPRLEQLASGLTRLANEVAELRQGLRDAAGSLPGRS